MLPQRQAASSQATPTLASEDPKQPSAPTALLHSDRRPALFVLVGCGFHSDASAL